MCAPRAPEGSTVIRDDDTAPSGPNPNGTYTCPLHPEVQQDTPGICPVCGTTLVPSTSTPVPDE
jgi:Cu+-exporting ATPase